MNEKEETKISKFMSMVLRHKPETIGLTLGKDGWVNVYEFIKAMNEHGHNIDMVGLKNIIEKDTKGRYSLDPKENFIRANQGHSAPVDMEFKEVIPPKTLFHGTNKKVVDLIFKMGLQKMTRHHVHLSLKEDVAVAVGSRRGSPVVLEVDAEQMHHDGFKFFISENGVYLTDSVPAKYLSRKY